MNVSISYPKYIKWTAQLEGYIDAYQPFSRSPRKKLRRSFKNFSEQDTYRFSVEPVTEQYLKMFVPLYEEYMHNKKNGIVYSVFEKVTAQMRAGGLYFSISLYKNNELAGGFIYSINKEYISTAYKVFPREFTIGDIPSSPTYMAEWMLYNDALQRKIYTIIHGRDLNVFGKNYAIGLAAFKLQLGCVPEVSQHADNEWLSTVEYQSGDVLAIFSGDAEQDQLTHLVLLSDQEEENIRQIYQDLFTQSILPVEIRKVQ